MGCWLIGGNDDREEKQSSMLQRITQHERPADKAYWSKLGYKSSLKEPRPKCRLFHDC